MDIPIQQLQEKFVGKRVRIRHPQATIYNARNQVGICVAVHQTEHNSVDVELQSGLRAGFTPRTLGETFVEGDYGAGVDARRRVELVPTQLADIQDVSRTHHPEPGCITAVRLLRQRLETHLTEREQEIEAQLKALAPTGLDKLFENDCYLISDLFRHGQHAPKYYNEEVESYGCKSLKELAAKLEELREAWHGLVDIAISKSESHRISVRFTPAGSEETTEG